MTLTIPKNWDRRFDYSLTSTEKNVIGAAEAIPWYRFALSLESIKRYQAEK